jgi:serine/threonine-protein kinase
MAAEQTITLLDRLRQCDLLEAAQLEELAKLPEAQDPDPRALGRVLLRREWLTRFQINLLARGRGKDLILGPYLILDRLGEGGMGEVFQARHRHMQRIVALKVIRKEKLANEEAVKRFYQEVHAAGQLHHPNIVIAYDAGQAGSTHYFAMEHVEGSDLSRLIRESGPLPAGQACEYVRQAALGLQHAHERGLVHRDIKPANLFVSWDKSGTAVVKILDMGLARIQSADGTAKGLTQTGQVMGTPDYLAPEQAMDAHTADIRSDLYSLGCTLYYLLTGKPPFSGDSLAQVLLKHQMAEPEAPTGGWGEIPSSVRKVLRKLLAKEPADRFQTPQELVEALQPLCGETGMIAEPPARSGNQKSVESDSGWQTLAGDGRDSPRVRPAKRKSGDSTHSVSIRQKTATQLTVGRPDRKLWIIAGSGLCVVLLLALALVLVLRSTRVKPAAQIVESAPADVQAPVGLVTLPPKVVAKVEDVPRVDPPAPAVVQPVPSPVAQLRRPIDTPKLETMTQVPKTPSAPKPFPSASGQSPLDLLDPGRLSAVDRQSLPAGLPVVAILPAQAGTILGVAFSPNSKLLAIASRDGVVRLWDLTAAEPKMLVGNQYPNGAVGSPIFSPDNRLLAYATRTNVVLVDVSLPFPKQIATIPGGMFVPMDGQRVYPEQVIGFSPDSKLLLMTSRYEVAPRSHEGYHSALKLWNLSHGEPRPANTQPLITSVMHCLSVSVDMTVFTGAAAMKHMTPFDRLGNSRGYKWSSSTAGETVISMCFSPDGSNFALTSIDGHLEVSHLKKEPRVICDRILGSIKAHDGWATLLGFMPDGNTVITRGEDNFVCWWNGAKRIQEWQLPSEVDLWSFTADGRYAACELSGQRIAIVRLPEPFQQP